MPIKNNIKYLDKNEKELIEAIHNSDYVQPADMKEQIQNLKKIAKDFSSKRKAINIRLLESDILKIKEKAAYEGIPYQTLIGSILHKFANDRL